MARLVCGMVTARLARARETATRGAHGATLMVLKHKWDLDVAARNQRHRTQLRTACGGGLDAIPKDPALSISEMLRELAEAAAPAGSRVSLHVDAFTEFHIQIRLKAPRDKQGAARTAKSILGVSSQYVHTISLLYTDGSVLELDRRAIERIADWRFADLPSIEQLLRTP